MLENYYLRLKNAGFVEELEEDLHQYYSKQDSFRVLVFPPLVGRLRLLIHKTVEEQYPELISFSIGSGFLRQTIVAFRVACERGPRGHNLMTTRSPQVSRGRGIGRGKELTSNERVALWVSHREEKRLSKERWANFSCPLQIESTENLPGDTDSSSERSKIKRQETQLYIPPSLRNKKINSTNPVVYNCGDGKDKTILAEEVLPTLMDSVPAASSCMQETNKIRSKGRGRGRKKPVAEIYIPRAMRSLKPDNSDRIQESDYIQKENDESNFVEDITELGMADKFISDRIQPGNKIEIFLKMNKREDQIIDANNSLIVNIPESNENDAEVHKHNDTSETNLSLTDCCENIKGNLITLSVENKNIYKKSETNFSDNINVPSRSHGDNQENINVPFSSHGDNQENINEPSSSHGDNQENIIEPSSSHGDNQENINEPSSSHGDNQENINVPSSSHGDNQENINEPSSSHGDNQENIIEPSGSHGDNQKNINEPSGSHGDNQDNSFFNLNYSGNSCGSYTFEFYDPAVVAFLPSPPVSNQPYHLYDFHESCDAGENVYSTECHLNISPELPEICDSEKQQQIHITNTLVSKPKFALATLKTEETCNISHNTSDTCINHLSNVEHSKQSSLNLSQQTTTNKVKNKKKSKDSSSTKVSKNHKEKNLKKADKQLTETINLNSNQTNSEHMTRKSKDDAHIRNSEFDDSWEALFDENGDCLDDSMMRELTEYVGQVGIDKPKINYLKYEPKEIPLDAEAFNHIIEIYDFPPELATCDLIAAFRDFSSRGFDVKWVDDTHALGVFSSSVAANEALKMLHPLLKVRPMSEASKQCQQKARHCQEFLQPYKARPETTSIAARRLVAGALGMAPRISKEMRDQERQKLKEAKERRRQERQQKSDMWDGSVSKCAMDEDSYR